jgi:hypothetical protein
MVHFANFERRVAPAHEVAQRRSVRGNAGRPEGGQLAMTILPQAQQQARQAALQQRRSTSSWHLHANSGRR